jgi:hypothetical protein
VRGRAREREHVRAERAPAQPPGDFTAQDPDAARRAVPLADDQQDAVESALSRVGQELAERLPRAFDAMAVQIERRPRCPAQASQFARDARQAMPLDEAVLVLDVKCGRRAHAKIRVRGGLARSYASRPGGEGHSAESPHGRFEVGAFGVALRLARPHGELAKGFLTEAA